MESTLYAAMLTMFGAGFYFGWLIRDYQAFKEDTK